MKTKILFLILGGTLLVSCSTFFHNTISEDIRTPTPSMSITPTEPLDSSLREFCPSITTDTPVNIPQFDGAILLWNYEPHDTSLSLIDTNTWLEHIFPQLENYDVTQVSVSPSRHFIAYEIGLLDSDYSWIDRKLMITTASGSLIKIVDEDETWQEFVWLDENQLLIQNKSVLNSAWPYVVLNPFTDERRDLIPNFPSVMSYFLYPDWGFYSVGYSLYNPTLTRVAYTQNATLTIWDLSSASEVAQFSEEADGGILPEPSPDGMGFAIIKQQNYPENFSYADVLYHADDFFYITWDGQRSRLSYLANYYSSISIRNYSWSPDGNKIAFWMSNDEKIPFDSYRLGILDIKTGDVIAFCYLGNPFVDDKNVTSIIAPLWSPNGKQVLIQVMDLNVENQTLTYMIDVNNNTIYVVAKNLEPSGWVATNP